MHQNAGTAVSSSIGCLGRNFLGYGDMGEHASGRPALLDSTFGVLRAGPEQAVMATWKLPLRKIVISRWLEDVANRLAEPSDYIPNGLDFKTFGMDVRPEDRDGNTIAMLYHHSDWKGSADGVKAICQVKAKIPQLRVRLFGVPGRPSGLPDWVEYNRNPRQGKLREIYNWAAIFMSPSWAEGWPLPPAEALQCGAVLAATDIGGHREYAIDGEDSATKPCQRPGRSGG